MSWDFAGKQQNPRKTHTTCFVSPAAQLILAQKDVYYLLKQDSSSVWVRKAGKPKTTNARSGGGSRGCLETLWQVTRAFLQTGAYRLRIHFWGGFPTSIAAPARRENPSAQWAGSTLAVSHIKQLLGWNINFWLVTQLQSDDKTWDPRLKLLLFRHSSALFYPDIHCQWSQITKNMLYQTLGGLDTKSSISAFLLLIVSFAWVTMCVSPFWVTKLRPSWLSFQDEQLRSWACSSFRFASSTNFCLASISCLALWSCIPFPDSPISYRTIYFLHVSKEKTWPQSSNLLLIFGSCFQRCLHILGLATRRHDNRFQSTKHIWMW